MEETFEKKNGKLRRTIPQNKVVDYTLEELNGFDLDLEKRINVLKDEQKDVKRLIKKATDLGVTLSPSPIPEVVV